jgi:hypothetical protein
MLAICLVARPPSEPRLKILGASHRLSLGKQQFGRRFVRVRSVAPVCVEGKATRIRQRAQHLGHAEFERGCICIIQCMYDVSMNVNI